MDPGDSSLPPEKGNEFQGSQCEVTDIKKDTQLKHVREALEGK